LTEFVQTLLKLKDFKAAQNIRYVIPELKNLERQRDTLSPRIAHHNLAEFQRGLVKLDQVIELHQGNVNFLVQHVAEDQILGTVKAAERLEFFL